MTAADSSNAARPRIVAVVLAGPLVRDSSGSLANLSFAAHLLVLARDGASARAYRDAGADWVVECRPDARLEGLPELVASVEGVSDRIGDGWLLVVDGEERLSFELRDELLRATAAVETSGGSAVAAVRSFTVPVTRYQCGVYLKYGGWRSRELRVLRASLSGPWPRPGDGSSRDLQNVLVHLGHRHIGDRLRWINQVSELEKAGLEGPVGARRLLGEPVGVFSRIYFFRGGWRDGIAGFVAAVLAAMRRFLTLAKAWELRHVVGGEPSGEHPKRPDSPREVGVDP